MGLTLGKPHFLPSQRCLSENPNDWLVQGQQWFFVAKAMEHLSANPS
jgi:hypothetical protein